MSETPDLIARLRKTKSLDGCAAAAEIERLTTALATAERERDEAREQFDRHVAWASDQEHAAEARIWREAAEMILRVHESGDIKLGLARTFATFTQRATQAETATRERPQEPI